MNPWEDIETSSASETDPSSHKTIPPPTSDYFASILDEHSALLSEEEDLLDEAEENALMNALRFLPEIDMNPMDDHNQLISRDSGMSLGLDLDDDEFNSSSFEALSSPSYTFVGNLSTSIVDHLHYCRTIQNSNAPCDCFPFASSLDFQVEQTRPPGKCQCPHKFLQWISVRWFSNFDVIGKLSRDLSRILCPLALSGFLRLNGELDESNLMEPKDYTIPFIISIEMNLDFISCSIESISSEQLQALKSLVSLLKSNNSGYLPQRNFFEELVFSINPVLNSDLPLCDNCVSKDAKYSKVKRTPSRGTRDNKKRQKTKSISVGSSADDVKSLLEKRRRNRAREQLSKCTSTMVPILTEAIRESASSTAADLGRVTQSDRIDESCLMDISNQIDCCIDHIFAGIKPFVAIGRLVGITRVLSGFSRSSMFVEQYEKSLKHWHELLQGNISLPLAKEIAGMLLGILSKHSDASDRCMELRSICSMVLNR